MNGCERTQAGKGTTGVKDRLALTGVKRRSGRMWARRALYRPGASFSSFRLVLLFGAE